MDKQLFLERLSINRPSVFSQYNYEFLPNEFKATDLVPIECYKHGLFKQRAYGHLAGVGCNKCGFERSAAASCLSTDAFIEKSKNNCLFSNHIVHLL